MDLPLQSIIEGLNDLELTRYAHLCALTIMTWEWLLTLDIEARYFWRGQWSTLIIILGSCNAWLRTFIPSQALVQWAIADAIICIRLCSLYLGNTHVVLFVGMLYACVICVTIALYAVFVPRTHVLASPIGGAWHSCSGRGTEEMFAVFIAPIVFEGIACAMTLWKIVQYSTPVLTMGRGSTTQLYFVMARDSLAYFVIMFCVYFVYLLFYRFASWKLNELFAGLVFALTSTSCSRLLMNPREVGARHDQAGECSLAFYISDASKFMA